MAGDGRDGKEEGERWASCIKFSFRLNYLLNRGTLASSTCGDGMETGADRLRRWDNEKDLLVQNWNEDLRELYNRSDKDAYDAAKLLIQSLLFIHAGALVAIPTYNSIQETEIATGPLATLLVIFSSGIVSALAAGVCAFFAMSNRADHSWTLSGSSEYRAWAKILRNEFLDSGDKKFHEMASSYDADAQKIDEKAKPFFDNYLKFRIWGIVLVLASGAALILAATVAAFSIGSLATGASEYQIQFNLRLAW